mmetsp:Transcript_156224/g.379376  ORF Transcript_156224/g.379376 Transcript_156224/m.379376 type:complete len:113 (-) Transcript_156224:90-428(-)
MDLPPEPAPVEAAAQEASPASAGAEEAAQATRGGPVELAVVVNVNRDLGVVFDFTVPKGTTVFGLKEMIAWQDPTDSLSPDDISLKLPGAADTLSNTVVLTDALTNLDLCEL